MAATWVPALAFVCAVQGVRLQESEAAGWIDAHRVAVSAFSAAGTARSSAAAPGSASASGSRLGMYLLSDNPPYPPLPPQPPPAREIVMPARTAPALTGAADHSGGFVGRLKLHDKRSREKSEALKLPTHLIADEDGVNLFGALPAQALEPVQRLEALQGGPRSAAMSEEGTAVMPGKMSSGMAHDSRRRDEFKSKFYDDPPMWLAHVDVMSDYDLNKAPSVESSTIPESFKDDALTVAMLEELLPGSTEAVEQVAKESNADLRRKLTVPELSKRMGRLARTTPKGQVPVMPFDESLPLLVDMLRSVRQLDDEGKVRLDLTDPKAVIVELDSNSGDFHAKFADAPHSTCLAGVWDDASGCGYREVAHAARLAPEPLGTSHNIWQVGLLFAKMCFGEYPTDKVVAEYVKGANLGTLGADSAGRQRAQEAIGAHFAIADDANFKRLSEQYPDVGKLLAGMLDVDPDARLTSTRALKLAESLAAARGVRLPAAASLSA